MLWQGLLLTVLAFTVYILRPVARWRFRHMRGDLGSCFEGGKFKFPGTLFLGSNPTIWRISSPVWAKYFAMGYGPVAVFWGIDGPWVSVVEPRLIRQVSAQINRPRMPGFNIGPNGHALTTMMSLFVRDDKWKSSRVAWMPMFYKQSLEGFEPFMAASADLLVQRVGAAAKDGAAVNIDALVQKLSLAVISHACFGISLDPENQPPGSDIDPKEATRMFDACNEWFTHFGGFTSRYLLPLVLFPELAPVLKWLAVTFPDKPLLQLMRAQNTLIDWLLGISRQQRALLATENGHSTGQPQNGSKGPAAKKGLEAGSFIDQMVRATDRSTGAGFTDKDVAIQAISMLMAGYDTTSSAMAFAVYCLAKYPETQAKLHAELDTVKGELNFANVAQLPYLDGVLKETVRLFPPGHSNDREAGQDLLLDGYRIPKGTNIICSFWAVQRDPKIWRDPETFQPQRWVPGSPEHVTDAEEKAWFGFGEGARSCVGRNFSLQEQKVTLARLFRAFSFKLCPGQDWLNLRITITLAPGAGVYVVPTRRH